MNISSKMRLSGHDINLLKGASETVKRSDLSSKRTFVVRYGSALLFPLAAFMLQFLWNSYFISSDAPFLLYFLAITLAALLGGFGPTMVATVLSVVLAYFSIGLNFPELPTREDNLQLLILVVEGAIIGIIAQARISSERDRARLLLQEHQAREDAEKSRDQRDEFIALASHEIKTPLTSIKGFNELLQKKLKGSRNEKVVEYLEYMHEQVDRLTVLVVDFLDTTKIRTGKLEITKIGFSIKRCIEKVVSGLAPAEKHRVIIARCDDVVVKADQTRIEQVLTNLISNAIKFSLPTKKIIIASVKDKKGVVVSVQDFGIGIDEEEQKQIFNQFYQSKDPARPNRGMGLGLYISSEIIKKHEGEIWLTSKKGEGSTFFFRLPEILGKNDN